MLALLALILSAELDKPVDIGKVLKMVIIHDLAEAVTGDIPSFEISVRQEGKHKAEEQALLSLVSTLAKNTAEEIVSLWNEFEDNKTYEAQFAQSLDKIEVLMQHNIADISTWEQGDFNVQPYYKDALFHFDSFMRAFKDIIDTQSMEKIIITQNTHRIEEHHLTRYTQTIKKDKGARKTKASLKK